MTECDTIKYLVENASKSDLGVYREIIFLCVNSSIVRFWHSEFLLIQDKLELDLEPFYFFLNYKLLIVLGFILIKVSGIFNAFSTSFEF